jgi:iron complex outermembrane recepter protein
MPELRPFATVRSATFISALLMSTAFTVPAFAQIETVVVTAERKAEDIQTVPIAVSAFGAADLQAHQITQFKDLQFAVPNVTVKNGNFGGANFQIRGIGSAAVTTSGDSGVAILQNDIYLSSPPTATGTYYDVQDIEILRGPQSTLYGRSASGGAVTITTAKPDLDNYSASFEGTYGNFAGYEGRGVVNVPIIQGELGVRVAAFYENKGGDVRNIYPSTAIGLNSGIASHIDSRNDYSVRGSATWQPSEHTLLELTFQYSNESDSRVRPVVQACHRDPSGILGCLPDHLAFDPVNTNATLGNIIASDLVLGGLGLIHVIGPGADPSNLSTAVPSDYRSVNTDFTPHAKGWDTLMTAHLHQEIAPWLSADVNVGFDQNSGWSQQSYGSAGEYINQGRLALVEGTYATASPSWTINNTFTGYVSSAANCAAQAFSVIGCATWYGIGGQMANLNYAQYWAPGAAGGPGNLMLPISAVGPWNPTLHEASGFGLAGGHILDYSNKWQSYDQISGRDQEWTGEARFRTSFDGPVNFTAGIYHIMNKNNAEYYVNATSLDYAAVVLGSVLAGGAYGCTVVPVPSVFCSTAVMLGPSQYDNNSKNYKLESTSGYIDADWSIIPDKLKLTVGGRFSHDEKTFDSRQTLYNTIIPAGMSDAALEAYLSAFNQPTRFKVTDQLTGHAILKYDPELDFTDATHLYLSVAHGARPGGFNPPSFSGAFPPTFKPEYVDAFEFGAKNQLLDNTLSANLTVWYYNYINYQVSKIVDRTSVNANFDARLWGVEGEIVWAPNDDFALNANLGYNGSEIGNNTSLDTRNPARNTPGATLVKDTNGANCVIYSPTGLAGSAPTPATDAAFAALLVPGAVTTLPGVAEAVYYSTETCGTALNAYLAANDPTYTSNSGVEANLHGNKMPNAPEFSFNIGAQYTLHIFDDMQLVPRVDFYWKGASFAQYFNAPTDRIPSWYTMNAQITLTPSDSWWSAKVWATNVLDGKQVTGSYVTDPSSGMFTNLFVEQARMFGLTLGAKF